MDGNLRSAAESECFGRGAHGTLRDGATVNAGINNVQTLTLAPNLTGGSFTLWFRIENESGEHILVETAAIDFDATALDLFKALSPILNPNGATIDIEQVAFGTLPRARRPSPIPTISPCARSATPSSSPSRAPIANRRSTTSTCAV